jgi:hypothetical protein
MERRGAPGEVDGEEGSRIKHPMNQDSQDGPFETECDFADDALQGHRNRQCYVMSHTGVRCKHLYVRHVGDFSAQPRRHLHRQALRAAAGVGDDIDAAPTVEPTPESARETVVAGADVRAVKNPLVLIEVKRVLRAEPVGTAPAQGEDGRRPIGRGRSRRVSRAVRRGANAGAGLFSVVENAAKGRAGIELRI